MKTALLALAALLSQHTSHYAGEQSREIKALSAEEVDALLAGRGMGLARAAELNRHPGPMHVLELAEPLQLTPEQREKVQASHAAMRAEALALGRQVVERERELDRLFANSQASDEAMTGLVAEIARLQGALRAAHLRAHLEMKRVLTPEQVDRYTTLRGY